MTKFWQLISQRYFSFAQQLQLSFAKIYPLVLMDTYLHLIRLTCLTPNGFFVQIFHLPLLQGPWARNISTIINLLELLIMCFLGYVLTEQWRPQTKYLNSLNTILILIINSWNFNPELKFSFKVPVFCLVIIISYSVARIWPLIPGKFLPLTCSLISGYLLNLLRSSTFLTSLPGISTSSRHINWSAVAPLAGIRNLAAWMGLIDPFSSNSQYINSPKATANLAQALSKKSLQNLPYPINIHSVYTSYAFLGGVGGTLGLIIALYLLKQNRLVLENIFLCSFGFNAPLLIGLPLLFNPFLLIPFILSPLVSMGIGACFINFGWAPPAVYQVFAGTPNWLVNFLGTNGNWASLIATILAIACSTAIYYPFIKFEVQHERTSLDPNLS
ncbi:hypothetical protein HU830_08480 [Lactobacillus sp. DCY120]|uniref:Uncharacterized protein n=1 Tax=Bombilactobacillus apium TaxID=2675299 RepID=A0A850R9F8_9LACO|nr:hypothetical protein [Bombilactobacillus apium]NVY97155.1 hypothetical protein [Bombilactobacillus apium]